jgi:PAS domain S-box-containing protein
LVVNPSSASHSTGPRPRRAVLWLAGLTIALALLDLLGWFTHRSALVGVFYGAATMKPNTALCLLLLAACVLCKRSTKPLAAVLGNALAGAAVVLAAATLLEYWTGRSFGIDMMLARVPPELAGDPVGRMAQGTALEAVFSGAALLLLDLAPLWASWICAAAGLLSVSALVGYLFDAGPLFGVPLLRSMALRTALAFFAVQVAMLLLRPQLEPMRSVLHTSRHHRTGSLFLLGSCLLPLLLGWPIAALYHFGHLDAAFAFALLVVVLMALQTWLVVANSRSLARVEARRERVEMARNALAEEIEQQLALVAASQKSAAESEALYRLITDALPSLVAYVDRDLCYVRANKNYETWYGVRAEEIEGRSIDSVLGGAALSVKPRLYAALAGTAQHFETQMKTLAGERTVAISHIPDFDAAGNVRGVVVQGADVTAARQAEITLRRTEKLAAVGKLASSIAHEINNPLEAVTNLLYLARTDEHLPADALGYLQMAESELGRVSAIASQTLRFHKQTTTAQPIGAEQLFETVLAIYKNRMTGRVALEERYRPARDLVCFEGEIRQVLNNLVGNALDALPSGKGRVLVRSRQAVSPKDGTAGLLITVADNGSGMSARTLESLFEAFFTTKGMNGTGLGLWVSKDIIDRHSGTLQVRSSQHEKHHGTVFRLFLPYRSKPLA